MSQLIARDPSHAPALILVAGASATTRFLEFFVSNIRNPNTRRSYWRGVGSFVSSYKAIQR